MCAGVLCIEIEVIVYGWGFLCWQHAGHKINKGVNEEYPRRSVWGKGGVAGCLVYVLGWIKY